MIKQRLRDLPIGVKVAAAPTLAMLCLLVVAGIGLWASSTTLQRIRLVGEIRLPQLISAAEIDSGVERLNTTLYQALAWEGAGAGPEMSKQLDQRFSSAIGGVQASVEQKLNAAGAENVDLQLYDDLSKALIDYKRNASAVLDMRATGLAAAASFMSTTEQSYERLRSVLGKLVTQETNRVRDDVNHADSTVGRSRIVIGVAFVIALFAGLVSTYLATILITDPLRRAEELASAIADGNLIRPDIQSSSDATGRVLASLSNVTDGLTLIVHSIRETADGVSLAAKEIAQGNTDLSVRTENTAASLQQTAATLQDLTDLLRRSATDAETASRLAAATKAVAHQGAASVNELVSTMKEIVERSQQVKQVVEVIDLIAKRTNILALNASVEAARAGDQGRGFNVVAQEVRSLALRCAESAREIRDLISHSVGQMDLGAKRAQAAGKTMHEVESSISELSDLVGAIASTSREQAERIEVVNTATRDMDQATQQNAALVEQAAAAAESLSSQAENLTHTIRRFRLDQ